MTNNQYIALAIPFLSKI